MLPLAVRPSIAGPVVDALLRDDRRALRALLDRVTVAVVPAATWRALDPDGRTLDDVDTPADLERRTAADLGQDRARAWTREDARPWEGGRASCWR